MSDLEDRLAAAMRDESAEVSARPGLADDMVARGSTARRRRRAVAGIGGLVVLAAVLPLWRSIELTSGPVGPAGPPQTASTSQPSTPADRTTPTTPSTAPMTTQPPAGWPTDPVGGAHHPARPPAVVDLRVGEHATYDRIVIDFDGPLPTYHVGYVDQLTQDGSGNPVALPGRAFILVSLSGVETPAVTGQASFPGAGLQTLQMPTLSASTYLGTFEGTASFGLGLVRTAGFTVSELGGPDRLVIDLHH